MTKSELVELVSQRIPEMSKKDTKVIVNVIFDSIVDALKKGEKIEIRGFGSFKVKKRDARAGRNPKTGAMVNIAENRTISFKSGKELKERIDFKSVG